LQTNTIVFRADKKLFGQIKNSSRENSITASCEIRNALTSYYNKTENNTNEYNVDLVAQLRSENLYLREIHDKLLARVVMLPENTPGTHRNDASALSPLKQVRVHRGVWGRLRDYFTR